MIFLYLDHYFKVVIAIDISIQKFIKVANKRMMSNITIIVYPCFQILCFILVCKIHTHIYIYIKYLIYLSALLLQSIKYFSSLLFIIIINYFYLEKSSFLIVFFLLIYKIKIKYRTPIFYRLKYFIFLLIFLYAITTICYFFWL